MGSAGCASLECLLGTLALYLPQTVTAGAAGSHHNRGWEPFTKEILKSVLKAASGTGGGPLASMFAHQKQDQSASAGGPHKGVVFLAWGLPAAKTLADAGITEVGRTLTDLAENAQRAAAQVAASIATECTPWLPRQWPLCQGQCMARGAHTIRQGRWHSLERFIVYTV